jgi:hypothetical protein
MNKYPQISEAEGRIAYLLLQKEMRDKGRFGNHKLNDVKREVVKLAEELEVKPQELYSLVRRLNNELLEEALTVLPQTLDFSKQG